MESFYIGLPLLFAYILKMPTVLTSVSLRSEISVLIFSEELGKALFREDKNYGTSVIKH